MSCVNLWFICTVVKDPIMWILEAWCSNSCMGVVPQPGQQPALIGAVSLSPAGPCFARNLFTVSEFSLIWDIKWTLLFLIYTAS